MGYLSAFPWLFPIFGISSLSGAYPFAILSMMLLFICFVVLLYAHLKRQRSTLSEILVVFAAILTSHSFVLVIFNLKIFYFLVFMSTLAAYFLLHQIKRQGNPYLHVFFLFNYVLGALVRPEFVLFSFPIAVDYLLCLRRINIPRKKLIQAFAILIIFVASFLSLSRNVTSASEKELSFEVFVSLFLFLADTFRSPHSYMTPVAFGMLFVFLLFLFKGKFLYVAYYLAIVAVLSSSLYLFEPSLYSFYYILFIFFFLDRAKKRKPRLWLSACIVIGFNFLILPAGSGSPMDFPISDYESGNEIMNFYSHYKSQNVTLYAVSAELFFMFLFYDTQCNVERQDSFKPCQSGSVLAISEESLEEFLDKCPEFNYVGQISSRIFVFESPDN